MSGVRMLRRSAACLLLCAALLLSAGALPEALVPEGSDLETEDDPAVPAALMLDEVQLDVEAVMQMPELPNSCEITSLTALLNYYGFSVAKETMASDYLPYEYFTFEGYEAVAPDPEEAYAGDPFGESYAYYCFAKPIVTAANAYFADLGADYVASDATGADVDQLIAFLLEGRPVIVWGTLHFEPPVKGGFWWRTEEGAVIEAYSNLHCFVLTGFDSAFMHLCDPLVGKIIVPADVFTACYADMGSRAVVLDRAPDFL